MGRQKMSISNTTGTVPTPIVNVNKLEQSYVSSYEPVKYVVIRDNKRVSDVEYDSIMDPKAILEMEFWNKIISRWPDGTKVEIVPFDKKKHRIW